MKKGVRKFDGKSVAGTVAASPFPDRGEGEVAVRPHVTLPSQGF